MNVSLLTKKIKTAYGVSTNAELAQKLGISTSAVEAWSRRKEVPQKYLFQCTLDTGVSLDWLLSEDKPTFHIKKESNDNLEISNYFVALESVAVATNKENELIEDIKELMKKYIG
jgi:transcriptional regulator with XRE-family HTH domain